MFMITKRLSTLPNHNLTSRKSVERSTALATLKQITFVNKLYKLQLQCSRVYQDLPFR